jgi:GGDEF domain-containing protein
MEEKQRTHVRAQREQLLTLVNSWDPAGLLGAGAPRDQYDFVIDQLLGLLSRRATKDEIAEFLEREVSARFGTKPPDAGQFATRAVAWFQLASREQ